MNDNSLKFIAENGHLLKDRYRHRFENVINMTALKSVQLIVDCLMKGPLTVSELSDRTGLHRFTVINITKVLEHVLFVREYLPVHGAPLVISLTEETRIMQSVNSTSQRSRNRKYLAILPDKGNFNLAEVKQGKFIFEDIESSVFRIISPEAEPWGREWIIWPEKIRQKKNGVISFLRVDFKLHQSSQFIIPARFERNKIEGNFTQSMDHYEFFNCCLANKEFLAYSFLPTD
jgi:hypothetical protein